MKMEVGKSRTLFISLIYCVISWILALLIRFNNGANDTYSLIIFAAYIILAIFGIYAMYLFIAISLIVTIVKAKKEDGDKSVIKPCIINSLISIVDVSIVIISYYIIDFHF